MKILQFPTFRYYRLWQKYKCSSLHNFSIKLHGIPHLAAAIHSSYSACVISGSGRSLRYDLRAQAITWGSRHSRASGDVRQQASKLIFKRRTLPAPMTDKYKNYSTTQLQTFAVCLIGSDTRHSERLLSM